MRTRRIAARPASPAQVWVAFPICSEARTSHGTTLPRLALAAAEKIGALAPPAAGLCAEETVDDTAAGVVAGTALVTGKVGGEDILALDVTEPFFIVVTHGGVFRVLCLFARWLGGDKFVWPETLKRGVSQDMT